MGRRIYIIPKSMKVEDALGDARLANCPEIAQGIPPALVRIIDEASLPMVYEEPEPGPEPEPVRDPLAEIDEIKAKIADYDELKAKVEALKK